MKAAIVQQPGVVPILQEVTEPTINSRQEVIVMPQASALSTVSKAQSMGQHYSSSAQFPRVAGSEGVGRLANGQSVYFAKPRLPYGSLAEQTVVSRHALILLPSRLNPIMAAAIANPGMSSYAALVFRAQIQTGDVVLINGATGTAGALAVKMAYALGAAKVIALGRNAEKLAQVGADEYFSFGTYDLADAQQFEQCQLALQKIIAKTTIVLDYLWGTSAELLLATLSQVKQASTIRYVEIGAAARQQISLPAALLRSSSIQLIGSGIGSLAPKELLTSIQQVFTLAAQKQWTVPIKTYSLTDLAQAWQAPNAPRAVIKIAD